MRKHNQKFSQRVTRTRNKQGEVDRTNKASVMAHEMVKDKSWQFMANSLLYRLFRRVGIIGRRDPKAA